MNTAGIPLLYYAMLSRKRETLSDPMAMDRELANNFPTVGSVVFLAESYKPAYWYFEVSATRASSSPQPDCVCVTNSQKIPSALS